LYLKQGWISWL